VKELTKIVTKAQMDYDRCEQQLEAVDYQRDYDELIVPQYDELVHERVQHEYAQYTKHITACEQQLDYAKQKQALKETFDCIKKPTTKLDEPDFDHQDIQYKLKQCSDYMRIQSEIDALCAEHEIEDDYDASIEISIQKQCNKLNSALNSIHESISVLENNQAEYTLLKGNRNDIQTKLDNLQEEIDNKRVTESLVAAYGPKGIKLNAIHNICSTLENNFNSMSKLIYNEDFSFEVSVSESGIDVIAHRSNGFMSDIKTLSGAESDNFKLLFLTALLPMIPEDRRTNIVILDEPSSHGDPVTREKFIHTFLPYLCKVIPSVYILEPQIDHYPDAHNLVVVKKNGVCTLQEDDRVY
jgi:DNA repair exonuclease SbcCD ATPase subunit